jgi:hypothetical protein
MSKGGGAGKVYFVLYLAVVLELLIIIVERDEAEENLHRKQKETMQIVESILTQLQAGSGTEGINTKPQDEITLVAPGMNAKDVLGVELRSDRQYLVEVGVTDIGDELAKRDGESPLEYTKRINKLVELGNVEDIEYQIFYSSSSDAFNAPMFPSQEDINKQKIDFAKFSPGQTIQGSDNMVWDFVGLKKLTLDKEKTFSKIDINHVTLESTSPIYAKSAMIGPSLVPSKLPEDSSFFYSAEKTNISHGLKKRTFMVNFEPPRKAGWYKLRFYSRTNRILGVRAGQKVEELKEDSKVNIGTVQLTVGDLQKVKKELQARLEKYNLPSDALLTKENNLEKFDEKIKEAQRAAFKEENAKELAGKVQLYGYICKLLAPGQSMYFPQNQGSIEFNVHVITPEPPQSTPELVLPVVRSFDKLPASFDFTISPFQGAGNNKISGVVKDKNGSSVANVMCAPVANNNAAKTPNGGKAEYIGTLDKNLAPGRYTIVMSHAIGSKKTDRETELAIFDTKLTQESEDFIKRRFEKAFYGTYHLGNQSVVPSSGGTIRPEEFRIYISSDDQGSQVAPIEGLSIPQNRAPYLTAKTNKVSMKITWKQPTTGKEVDLLPLITSDVRLRQPGINLSTKVDESSQSGNKWRMTIRNINVSTPELDANTKAKVTLKADRPTIEGVDNNAVSLEMSQPRENGGSWEIELSATVKLPPNKSSISGTINIPLTAVANAKDKSSSAKTNLTASFEYKKESRGGSGGGAGRPSGGTPKPTSGGGSKRR